MSYTPDVAELEAALKQLHNPEALRLRPIAALDIVHQRVASEQRVSGERQPPLPWIYGYELSILLRSLVDNLDDHDEDIGADEGRRATSRLRLYARILKLRFGQGLSWAEVAAEVGRVAGHIQNKLKRPALQMLLGELLRIRAPVQPGNAADQARPLSNLPPQGEFIGRRAELEQVLAKLRWRRLPITDICGMGGVGKSELAKRAGWVALTSERLFDAVVWLSAQESYLSLTRFQAVSAASIVRSLGDLLDITVRVLGSGPTPLELADKQRQLVSTLTSGHFPRGVLLIIDGYQSLPAAEQQRIASFLFNQLPYPSQALITSRHQEQHALMHPQVPPSQVRLGRMSVEDTRACLLHLLEHEQPPLPVSPLMAEQISAAADGVPLALLWLLGQMRHSPRSLGQVLGELQGEQALGSPLLNYIFDQSYQLLAPHPHAQQLLHSFIAFTYAASLDALSMVAGLTSEQGEAAAELLVQLSLASKEPDPAGSGELAAYGTLPLTRSYIGAKLSQAEREEYMLRACSYYCAQARPLPQARPNLIGLIEWAITAGQHQASLALFDTLTEGNLIGSPTQVQDCASYGAAMVHTCEQLGLEERADWYILYAVCWPQVARRHIGTAQAQLLQLLKRAQQRAWYGNQALASSTLGLLYYDQVDVSEEETPSNDQPWTAAYDQATAYLEAAARLWEQLGRHDWLAVVLGRLAAIRRSSGDYAGALTCYVRAEALYDALGDTAGKALTMRRRAQTMLQHYRLGHAAAQAPGLLQEIGTLLDQALLSYGNLGDRRGGALTRLCYAELLASSGDLRRAAEHANAAQADFAYIHDSYGVQRAGALAQQLLET